MLLFFAFLFFGIIWSPIYLIIINIEDEVKKKRALYGLKLIVIALLIGLLASSLLIFILASLLAHESIYVVTIVICTFISGFSAWIVFMLKNN